MMNCCTESDATRYYIFWYFMKKILFSGKIKRKIREMLNYLATISGRSLAGGTERESAGYLGINRNRKYIPKTFGAERREARQVGEWHDNPWGRTKTSLGPTWRSQRCTKTRVDCVPVRMQCSSGFKTSQEIEPSSNMSHGSRETESPMTRIR